MSNSTFLGLALALTALVPLGCSGNEYTGTQIFQCPDADTYAGLSTVDGGAPVESVSGFMERRCGMLDCHGSVARPLRIYGQYGLRYPTESNFPGGAATTLNELSDNYGAVCSVTPEQMNQVVADPNSADQLLMIRKARGIEAHKGGTVVTQGDAGDTCMIDWLMGDALSTVAPICQDAIARLNQGAAP
jgi:hypothetical protein